MLRLIVYQISTQGLNSLLGLVYWAVAARMLALGDVGRAAATLALIAFLAATSNLGFGTALIRHRSTRQWDYPRLAGSVVWGASFVATILCAVIAILGPASGGKGIVVTSWALLPMVVIALVGALLDSMSLADNDGAGVLIRNQTATLGKLLLLVLIVRDSRALVVTTTGALLLSGLIVWPRRRRSVRLWTRPRLPSRFVVYALKQYVVTWLANLPNYLFPILALALLGPEVAGYVALAWGGASLLLSAGDAAGIALLRQESYDRRSLDRNNQRALLEVATGLAASVALAVVAAPLLTLVFGPRFDANAIALFRLFAVASLPYFVASTTVSRLQARDRSSGAVVLAATSGLGGCALLLLLAPLVGGLAPGWAYLVANVAAAVVALWFIRTKRAVGDYSFAQVRDDGLDRREAHPAGNPH